MNQPGVFGQRSPFRTAVAPRETGRAGVTPTLPRARKKKRTAKKPDDASVFAARAEGASPERGGDSVVKPGGSRIGWAQLPRRIHLVDVLACPCGGRRAIVADISERDVVVAILAHLGLPPFAPPIARARSPGFDFT